MAGIKELRVRIKSVGNIKQITRAMEMVASTKLRRFQDRAIASRPYSQEIAGLVKRLSSMLGDDVADQPLFNPGKGERSLVLLITSDRGLCGAYNTMLFREMEQWLKGRVAQGLSRETTDFFVYGRKGAQYLTSRGYSVKRFITDPPMEEVDYRTAALTGRMLVDEFETGEYKDVHVVFTAFESMVKYVPQIVPFLPLTPDSLGVADGAGASANNDAIMEPDAATIFESLVPRYLEIRIYNSLLESLTSEYASRRFAMKNATDAANDMQKELKGIYNRKRQENITKELLDIVGGSEAVK
ncbi:ATP synthase gamma chain [Planctomycetes bacterium Poly30]|uniref:ATP synthase gamma chain n=1 Tax=Saltatorellus ferox TaxID=2528018 RepID=A0A518ERM2_9BACT|nr:ATP synthase gamma chain [Planctomycetes bacterium Poly30]